MNPCMIVTYLFPKEEAWFYLNIKIHTQFFRGWSSWIGEKDFNKHLPLEINKFIFPKEFQGFVVIL